MKKVTIEIELPDSIDLEHADQSVMDALYFSGNVTQAEHDLVATFLHKLSLASPEEALISRALEHVKADVKAGDVSAVYELLRFIPRENLIEYLPEEEWSNFKNQ